MDTIYVVFPFVFYKELVPAVRCIFCCVPKSRDNPQKDTPDASGPSGLGVQRFIGSKKYPE